MLALHPPPVEGCAPGCHCSSGTLIDSVATPDQGAFGGSTNCGVDCPVSHRQAKTARVQASPMFHVLMFLFANLSSGSVCFIYLPGIFCNVGLMTVIKSPYKLIQT